MNFFDIIDYPFMLRALSGGVILAILLGSLGIFVGIRKMAFFADGIAHASLAGIAIGILAGIFPLGIAILWGLLVAVAIFILERKTHLSSDTLIGILFTGSMALGVVLMSITKGYQPELISFLFGNILSVTTTDLWIIFVLGALILSWLVHARRSLLFISLSEESAKVHGIKVDWNLFIFYLALALSVVLSVKIFGIVLVAALLILPSALARLFAVSFRNYFWMSIIFSELVVLSGLITSFIYDIPSGATIVLVGTVLFMLSSFVKTT